MRQDRLRLAQTELETLRNELAFEQITIELTDEGKHWQFKYGNKHLADYWPASGRGQIVGQAESVECVSAAQAQRLALSAKRQFFGQIASALKQRKE